VQWVVHPEYEISRKSVWCESRSSMQKNRHDKTNNWFLQLLRKCAQKW